MVHDMDCDGFVSPKDLVDFQTKFCNETNYLIPFDIIQLTDMLMAKMNREPEKTYVKTAEDYLQEANKKLEEQRDKINHFSLSTEAS